jgi:ssRNA-specific RNase YbeY (16S rRNA maturation enzyme)
MRQKNVDFQNRERPTNILALLLVTTRRPQSEWRLGDTVLSPERSGQLCPAALQQLSDDDWSAAA